jgi:hypothetical protein
MKTIKTQEKCGASDIRPAPLLRGGAVVPKRVDMKTKIQIGLMLLGGSLLAQDITWRVTTNTALLVKDIVFTNKTATFTNEEGRVYKGVTLIRANREGIVWRGEGMGLVSYTNLSPALLESLGIPVERIEQAKARAEQRVAANIERRAALAAAAQVKSATAEEVPSQITGAFGIKLGQTFRVASGAETEERYGKKYSARCPFTPTARLPNFSEYMVCVTPRSNHAFSVSATAYFGEDSLKAYAERDKIVAALEEKYGKAEHTTSRGLHNEVDCYYDTITKGNRTVEIRSMGWTHSDYEIARLAGTEVEVYPAFVVIDYSDLLLKNEAEKELREPVPGL